MTRSIAVALLLLAWATPDGRISAQKTDREIPDPSKWTVMTGIDLTEEQKAAILKVVSQYAQYEDWLSGKLKVQATYPDSISKARALATKDSTKEQIVENRLNQIHAVREILTQEQRNTFDNNVMELIARHQKRQASENMRTAKRD